MYPPGITHPSHGRVTTPLACRSARGARSGRDALSPSPSPARRGLLTRRSGRRALAAAGRLSAAIGASEPTGAASGRRKQCQTWRSRPPAAAWFTSSPAASRQRPCCECSAPPDDPPTVGRGGRQFILLAPGNLDDVVQRAHLAGLTIEVRQPTTTTNSAHPTDWVDPVKLQQQAAAWKQAGVPDHEIAARNFEAVLASVKRSRQMLLPHHRTYEPGTSEEEQDALMDETLAIYDRVLEQLPALIRRMRMRVVEE